MGTIVAVVVVAVALLAIVVFFLPTGATIRTSLAKYMVLDDVSGAIEKSQPHGQIMKTKLEVTSEGGRFRVEVADGTSTREIIAQRKDCIQVAVSFIPTIEYSQAPTYAIILERSSITYDPILNYENAPTLKHKETRERVEQLVREGLKKKGFTETDASAADLHVAYHRVIKGKFGHLGVSEDDEPCTVEIKRDSERSLPKPDDKSQPAVEQALVLELYDAGSGVLTWRAAVQATWISDVPAAEKERRARMGIDAMLATYPPPKRQITQSQHVH